MTYYVKGLVQKEYETKFAEVPEFLIVSTTGLDGIDSNQMRNALKDKGIRLAMVKNSMMRRALDALGHSAARDLFLAGPCTVAYGGDSIVDIAKELAEWSKKFEVIEIRGAYLEGDVMDSAGAKALAKIKPWR